MGELDREEGWPLKNWCFRIAVLEKTHQSPLNSKKIKLVNPKRNQLWILIGLIVKLKLQYFGHLMQKANSLEKTLTLGKIEGRRRRGQQRMHWLDGIIDSMDMSLSKLQKKVKGREAWCAALHGVGKRRTALSDWRTTTTAFYCLRVNTKVPEFPFRRKRRLFLTEKIYREAKTEFWLHPMSAASYTQKDIWHMSNMAEMLKNVRTVGLVLFGEHGGWCAGDTWGS